MEFLKQCGIHIYFLITISYRVRDVILSVFVVDVIVFKTVGFFVSLFIQFVFSSSKQSANGTGKKCIVYDH
jgi:hypothetical protein